MTLEGFQRRYLRGLAHHLSPSAHIGQGGITPAVLTTVGEALDAHELIKVRLVQFTEQRKAVGAELAEELTAELVGTIGNVLILYRPSQNPERSAITLPQR